MCIFSHKNSFEKRSVTDYCFMGDARDTFSRYQITMLLLARACPPESVLLNKYSQYSQFEFVMYCSCIMEDRYNLVHHHSSVLTWWEYFVNRLWALGNGNMNRTIASKCQDPFNLTQVQHPSSTSFKVPRKPPIYSVVLVLVTPGIWLPDIQHLCEGSLRGLRSCTGWRSLGPRLAHEPISLQQPTVAWQHPVVLITKNKKSGKRIDQYRSSLDWTASASSIQYQGSKEKVRLRVSVHCTLP